MLNTIAPLTVELAWSLGGRGVAGTHRHPLVPGTSYSAPTAETIIYKCGQWNCLSLSPPTWLSAAPEHVVTWCTSSISFLPAHNEATRPPSPTSLQERIHDMIPTEFGYQTPLVSTCIHCYWAPQVDSFRLASPSARCTSEMVGLHPVGGVGTRWSARLAQRTGWQPFWT